MELENVAEIEVELQESGPAGEQGPPGLSAYEVYLVNGGTLSEKEWLESLKGDTGKEGYTPVKGEDYFTEEDIASLKIPTKVSDLENDSGFITSEEVEDAIPVKTFVIERKFNPSDGQRTYSTIPDAELEVCNKMIECAIKGEPFVVYFKNLYEDSNTPSTFMYKYTNGYKQGDTYFQIKFNDFAGIRKVDVWYRISVDTDTNQVVTTGTKLLTQVTFNIFPDTKGNADITGIWTLSKEPTNFNQLVNKQYVDDTIAAIPTSSDPIKTFEIEFNIDTTSTNVNTYNSIDDSVRNENNLIIFFLW